jgi:integrase
MDRVERLNRDPYKLRLVARWFPSRNAADITSEDVERELNRLRRRGHRDRARGLAPATLNRFRATLSRVFTLAMRNKKVLENPVRLIPMERENNVRVRFLSVDEEVGLRAKVRQIAPEREADLDLALHMGLRKGEQYSLRWNDVDLINGFLTVVRGKGNKKRHVPLNADARAALAVLRRRADDSGYFCPGGMGKGGYRAVREWFSAAVRAAGINDFTWHDLRHTFASRLRMGGVELATIKELLGHTTLTMVLRYAHLAPGYLQKAVDKIATFPTENEEQPESVTMQ